MAASSPPGPTPKTPAAANLLNGKPNDEYLGYQKYTDDNRHAWDTIANYWEESQSAEWSGKPDDGNDMFQLCLLPVVEELANWQPGQTVLDLGAGSGIIARLFAKKGARVTGLDFSYEMLSKGRESVKAQGFEGSIDYGYIDLMDPQSMADYMDGRKKS